MSLFQGYSYFKGVSILGVSLFQGYSYFNGVSILRVSLFRVSIFQSVLINGCTVFKQLNKKICSCTSNTAPHLREHSVWVGPQPVQFVNECDPRDAISIHLSVDSERLALHPAHGTQHQHRPIQHTQGSLHLDGEVDMTCGGSEG